MAKWLKNFMFRIWTTAWFEAKETMRGKLFLISFPLLLGIMILTTVYYFIYSGSAIWTYRAIPSSIPYVNTLLLNFLLAFVSVFLVMNCFETRDGEGISAALKARSFSNIEYFSGKALGLLLIYGVVHGVILSIVLVMNFVFVRDVPPSIAAYFVYPLLISIPTVAAIAGMAYIMFILLRNKWLVTIYLLVILFILKYVSGKTGSYTWDIFAFNLPLAFSSLAGFAQSCDIFMQRISWLFFGLFGILLASTFYERPEQMPYTRVFSLSTSLVLFAGFLSINYVHSSISRNHAELRSQIRMINQQELKKPIVTLTRCQIDLTHRDREISADTKLIFTNQTSNPLIRYSFNLNPGLYIDRVSAHGKILPFTRNLHMITVDVVEPLAGGETDSLEIRYHGSIQDYTSFADIPEKKRNEPFALNLIKVGKRISFVQPEYLLLTAESMWYPTPGVPYGSVPPYMQPQHLANFILTVHAGKGMTVLSQGEMHRNDTNSVTFKPEHPLPKISLIIGKYEKKSVSVDGVEYAYYNRPGHDFFSKNIIAMRKEMPQFVRYIADYNESLIPLPYPYNRLSVVEIPSSFYAYDRPWCFHQDTIQPEQIFVHERGMLLGNINFKNFLHFRTKISPVETRKEIENDYLIRLFCWDFLNEKQFRFTERLYTQGLSISSPGLIQSYQPFPNWFNFLYDDGLDEEGLFISILENYLRSRVAFQADEDPRPDVAACQALNGNNLKTILSDPAFEKYAFHVVNLKSKCFFQLVRSTCGDKDFDTFLYEYLLAHRWGVLNADDFFSSIYIKFRIDLRRVFSEYCMEKNLPSFEISNVEYNELLTENGTCGQLYIIVNNCTNSDGIIEITSNRDNRYKRYIRFSKREIKQIGVTIKDLPCIIRLNTMISTNIPNRFEFDTLKIKNESNIQNKDLFDSERILNESYGGDNEQIIVDNEDKGFELVSQPKEKIFYRIFKRKEHELEPYNRMNFGPIPQEWLEKYNQNYYGRTNHSAHVIKSGTGDAVVAWNTHIEVSGEYEIFFHVVDYTKYPIPVSKDFHFNIYSNSGMTNKVLDCSKYSGEWASLGTYSISEGNSQIRLNNLSRGMLLYADAVKWKRISLAEK